MTLDGAIMLYRQGRLGEAQAATRALLAGDPGDGQAWGLLGFLERDLGDTPAAAAAFDRAIALDPRDAVALKGRARMALERDEPDTVARYEAARAVAPDDRHLVLEQAEARLAAAAPDALADLSALAARLPNWAEGQIALAKMRWESRRDPDFADPVRRLLDEDPYDEELWHGFVTLLEDCRLFPEAAEAAREANMHLRDPVLTLAEAANAGQIGELDRADALLANLPMGFPGRARVEAIHRIRRGEAERAAAAIEAALAEGHDVVANWAIAELVWRWTDDPRAAWLSGQPGLVREADLDLSPDRFAAIHAALLRLHENGVEMAGQSVKGGKQTRGRLFDRIEPEFAELKRAVEAGIADYVVGLPPFDPTHPLLRHRDAALAIGGSWSVRFVGHGYHVSHTHPLGVLSSACYFEVPDAAGGEGELLLGAPPPDLLLDLPPLHVVTPRPGKMALFPSYLHHATRAFTQGTRMSVAFDLIRKPA